MLNSVNVKVAPFRPRGSNERLNTATGASVAVYKDGPTVGASAVLANIYQDRLGVNALPNPMTMDFWGGPAGVASNDENLTMLQFYCWEDVVHLIVTAPDGRRFSIPNVQTTPGITPNKWCEVRIHDLYNNTDGATSGNAPGINFSSGGSQDVVVARVIAWHNAGTPAANNAFWAGEEAIQAAAQPGDDPFLQNSDETSLIGLWGRPFVVEGDILTDVATAPTATMITGLGMGYSSVVPIAGSPNKPLAILYSRWDTPAYELLLAKGSGASEKLVMTGVATPTITTMDHLRVVYVPGLYVEGFVNGKSGGRITTAAKFPLPGSTGPAGFNGFAQSGSSASGEVSFALWNCRYFVRMP